MVRPTFCHHKVSLMKTNHLHQVFDGASEGECLTLRCPASASPQLRLLCPQPAAQGWRLSVPRTRSRRLRRPLDQRIVSDTAGTVRGCWSPPSSLHSLSQHEGCHPPTQLPASAQLRVQLTCASGARDGRFLSLGVRLQATALGLGVVPEDDRCLNTSAAHLIGGRRRAGGVLVMEGHSSKLTLTSHERVELVEVARTKKKKCCRY